MEGQLEGTLRWGVRVKVGAYVNHTHDCGENNPPTGIALNIPQSEYDRPTWGQVRIFMSFDEAASLSKRLQAAIGEDAP